MQIRPVQPHDLDQLVDLVAHFRMELAALQNGSASLDRKRAAEELAECTGKGCRVFVAAATGERLVGYLICRVDGRTVWAESLFVAAECRRSGVGSRLYAEAERLADDVGAQTVYNWVHPNNEAIISFLNHRGYDVLNLIELRRVRGDEQPRGRIRVGDHDFRY